MKVQHHDHTSTVAPQKYLNHQLVVCGVGWGIGGPHRLKINGTHKHWNTPCSRIFAAPSSLPGDPVVPSMTVLAVVAVEELTPFASETVCTVGARLSDRRTERLMVRRIRLIWSWSIPVIGRGTDRRPLFVRSWTVGWLVSALGSGSAMVCD
jgi:hypothetical protein